MREGGEVEREGGREGGREEAMYIVDITIAVKLD